MSQTASNYSEEKTWLRRLLPWVFDAGFAPTVIVIMVMTMTFKSDVFMTSRNLQNILLQTSFLAIAAFGMTFVIIAAELDLSQGSSIALIGVVTADVMANNQNILLATGILIGLVIGFVSVVLRVPSFITTLGMLVMARGLAREITAGSTIGGIPDGWMDFWSYKFLGLRLPIWSAALVGIVFHIILRYTRFGLHVYAVGGNTEAARRAGINVTKVRVAVFLMGGLALSIAAFTLLGRVNSGQPNAAVLTELFAVAAVVLGGTNLFGGRGSIPRTLAGVLLIGVLRNSLNLLNVSSNMQDVWIGLVFMLAMTSELIRSRVLRFTASLKESPEVSQENIDLDDVDKIALSGNNNMVGRYTE